MIELNDITSLSTEDFLQQITAYATTIKDLLNDIELLTKIYVNDRNLTAEDVAERLRCEVSQVPRDIPCCKVGRMYIYKESDLNKWIRDHKKSRC